MAGIGRTNVSANNAFLTGIEVVEGGRAKSTTSKGTELALALEHEMPDEISKAWRKIVEENDFLNKMVQAISVRKGMEISHLQNHIAYSAGESKAKYVMTGAKTVMDILKASGLVREDNDKILPNTEMKFEALDKDQITTQRTDIDSSIPIKGISISPGPNSGGVTLHIEVRINASPNDLDGLGKKLRKLIESIATGDPENTVQDD